MKLISIIIPLYNNKRYLSSCLDSIVNQYAKGIEVIIVNDGSTDGSGSIADRYAMQYSFIKVIHQSNKGVSAARNTAIRESIGSYLVFSDSDDLLYKGFFQKILELIKNKPDIIEINADVIDEAGLVSYKKIFSSDIDRRIIDSTNIAKKRFSKQAKYYLWLRIIRKEMVNHLYFDETIRFCEDALYLTACYFRAKKIITLDESLYGYRQHDSNVTRVNSVKNINELTKLCNTVKKNINNSEDEQYKVLYLSLWINMAHLRKSMYALEFKKINFDDVTIQQIRNIKNNNEWSFFRLRNKISWLRLLSIVLPKTSNMLILVKHYIGILFVSVLKR